ncbi:MAG: DUF839 domain-containing protein [Candidatus Hydrogenedens sp.]|nr:DUF839 domain-containing protein [Candidatus Hydrogenedens sp.]
MNLTRRHFLGTAGAFGLGFGGLGLLFQDRAMAVPSGPAIAEGFGPLRRDPEGRFDLPEGFRYRIVSRKGDRMSDGLLVPGRPDGMAAFPGPDGTTILVRNHEISSDDPENGAYGEDRALASGIGSRTFYDDGFGKTPGLGGTSTLVYNTRTGELVEQHMSLLGTVRNCAGGPTPWGSWISCEEDVSTKDDLHAQDHGWCFEVPAIAGPTTAEPKPIVGMGRFNHEAIAIDPVSGVVYLTEDRPDGLIYRYIPNVPGKLHEGGKLQALARKAVPSFDTRNWGDAKPTRVGETFEVEWLDLEGIDSPQDDLRLRGFERGATRFARGEGMWYGNGAVYFACTNGGSALKGQIFKYVPSAAEGTTAEAEHPGRLTLFVEPNDGGLIDNCDNLTVSPWGDLVACEDGSGEQYLVGVTPEGAIYKFGRNADAGNSELAGATFSPDGSTLFLNVQSDGLTLAITGPWKKRTA